MYALMHHIMTLILWSGFTLGQNPLVSSHHCRGLMYSRQESHWTQLTLDPAVFETACQWVTGLLSLSWLLWGLTWYKQGTDGPALRSNPRPHPHKWYSVMEKAHFSCRLVLTANFSCGREQHLNVEPPSAPIELKSTNRQCNSVCGCPGVAAECGVRMQGQREEPDIGIPCPWKQTSGTSCEWEGRRHVSMRLLDLSLQTSPWTWSETRPVWVWASWISVAWLSSSIDADLKWDATPLLWNYEVPAVETGLSLLWGGTTSMASFLNNRSLLVADQSINDSADTTRWRAELNKIAFFYHMQDPLRHIWH